MLYLSQPIGTGFSYSEESPGTLNDLGDFEPPSVAGIDGGSIANPKRNIRLMLIVPTEWPVIDPYTVDTTQLAAVAAWHTIQGFLTNLPRLDSKIKSKNFNLWTESYGGHC
jgi:hypothetical protein